MFFFYFHYYHLVVEIIIVYYAINMNTSIYNYLEGNIFFISIECLPAVHILLLLSVWLPKFIIKNLIHCRFYHNLLCNFKPLIQTRNKQLT